MSHLTVVTIISRSIGNGFGFSALKINKPLPAPESNLFRAQDLHGLIYNSLSIHGATSVPSNTSMLLQQEALDQKQNEKG